MSLCIGICQIDESGYCIGCGRSESEIYGEEPSAPPALANADANAMPEPARPAPLDSKDVTAAGD